MDSFSQLDATTTLTQGEKAIIENRALKGELGNLESLVSDQSAQIGRIQAQVADVTALLSDKDATIARLRAELIALRSRQCFSGPQ